MLRGENGQRVSLLGYRDYVCFFRGGVGGGRFIGSVRFVGGVFAGGLVCIGVYGCRGSSGVRAEG